MNGTPACLQMQLKINLPIGHTKVQISTLLLHVIMRM